MTAFDRDGNEVDETTRVLNTADNGFALNRQPFLSGIITSYNSFKFKYGRVEARASMPAGKGLWSAVWLLNAYYKQDQPQDPEIDIMEAIGDRTTTGNHAYHDVRDNDRDGVLPIIRLLSFVQSSAIFRKISIPIASIGKKVVLSGMSMMWKQDVSKVIMCLTSKCICWQI